MQQDDAVAELPRLDEFERDLRVRRREQRPALSDDVGNYHLVKGWTAKFLKDLREHPGTWAVRAGRFGYVAKGIALGVVGALFVLAAATRNPEKAQGLDGALRTLLEAPFGPVLLTIVALGLASYGVYSFARARYARV